MKYYAVVSGKKPGIYTSWPECKAQVQGFSNAIYKSFPTRQQAEEYMNQNQQPVAEVTHDKEKGNLQIEEQIASLAPNEVIAFVDGSFSKKKEKSGFGVFLFPEKVSLQQSFSDPQILQSRNFAAEMIGAASAMKWAMEHNKKVLYLYFDYQGIRDFALGFWQPKHPLAKWYRDYYLTVCKKLNVQFFKVPAHSGIEYNEIADQLAKKALDLRAHISFKDLFTEFPLS